MIKARGGFGVKKNKFGLYQSPTCHRVNSFLQNRKIFVYVEKMACQTSGVLLIPIQNVGG